MSKDPKTVVAEYLATIRDNPDLKFQRVEDHMSNLLLSAEDEGFTQEDLEAEVGDLRMGLLKAMSRPS